MRRGLFLLLLSSVFIFSIQAQIQWKQVESGVWKGVVGIPEEYSLLQVSGVSPLKEGFSRLPEVELPVLATEIEGNVRDSKTYLSIPYKEMNSFMDSG